MILHVVSRFLIYGLRDPRTREIRYVGRSSSGLQRPRTHMTPGALRRFAHLHVTAWIRELLGLGLRPEIVVLQVLDRGVNDLLNEAEKYWISVGRAALGHRFTNMTNGGDGLLGYRHSDLTRSKQAASYRPISAESIAKMAETKRLIARTPVGRIRLENALRKSLTPESIAKVSETRRRLASTPEGRARLLALVEVAKRPDARRNQSLAQCEYFATPQGREQIARMVEAAHTPDAIIKGAANRRRCDCVPVWGSGRLSKRCVHGRRQSRLAEVVR